jgi:DnaJ like chaperone protein
MIRNPCPCQGLRQHGNGWRTEFMGVWGKVLGGVAGFAMGGPFGAVMGAALGHSVDQGGLPGTQGGGFRLPGAGIGMNPARIAAMLGQKEQVFAISVVALSAKLAKCDGVVVRAEIDAFKRMFRIPPESVRDVGRMFDQARQDADGYVEYARALGDSFADNRLVLEDVLAALFAIARADKPVTQGELAFLQQVHMQFGLDRGAWERAAGGQSSARAASPNEPDAYAVLGVARTATDAELRAAWKQLMRENHPDTLAARGVPADFVQRASDKVAGINAAWDRIKRERGL